MLEEEIEFVKVDTLKPRLGNENVTAKVVDIGEPRSVTSRRDYSVRARTSPFGTDLQEGPSGGAEGIS